MSTALNTALDPSMTEAAKQAKAYPRRGKRRATHNEAERRRARRINDQITKLKELVSEDGAIPSDKHGVLIAAVDTIRDLRSRLMRTKQEIAPSSLVPKSMPSMLPADFRTLYLKMPTASTMVGVDGTFLTCTESFSALSGIPMASLDKYTMFSLTTPAELPAMYKVVGELMSGRASVAFTKTCRFKSHNCLVTVEMLVLHERGQHIGFTCTLSTDRCPHPSHGNPGTRDDSETLTPLSSLIVGGYPPALVVGGGGGGRGGSGTSPRFSGNQSHCSSHHSSHGGSHTQSEPVSPGPSPVADVVEAHDVSNGSSPEYVPTTSTVAHMPVLDDSVPLLFESTPDKTTLDLSALPVPEPSLDDSYFMRAPMFPMGGPMGKPPMGGPAMRGPSMMAPQPPLDWSMFGTSAYPTGPPQRVPMSMAL